MGRYVPWRSSNYSEDSELFTSEEITDIMVNRMYSSDEVYEMIHDKGFTYCMEHASSFIEESLEEWCDENLSKDYTLVDRIVFFQDENDAMAFKLYWS